VVVKPGRHMYAHVQVLNNRSFGKRSKKIIPLT